jgi:hypothetical protein
MILTLGIIALAALVLFPLAIAGLACGIIAWVFGHKDLGRIQKGEMDPEGEGATRAGMVCGMIATIVDGLAVVLQLTALGLALAGVGFVGASCMSCCCFPATLKSGTTPQPGNNDSGAGTGGSSSANRSLSPPKPSSSTSGPPR